MKAKTIGILGSGDVGKALAGGFIKHGFEVMIGSGSPGKLSDWQKENPAGKTGSFSEAAAFGEILVLAVKGTAAKKVLQEASSLAGKIVIDATNPIAEQPPQDGVLKFFTTLDHSLMEDLQENFPSAKFVKAFSCVGNPLMVNPDFGGIKPTMFIAGNDAEAKSEVKEILTIFGWETEDMGTSVAARAIEPLCILWCIPGFRQNQWMHAFKLLKSS